MRSSCFGALDVLQARYCRELPYQELAEGFSFRGARVPFFAHIVADPEEAGEPLVSNGLSLCSIHHRAFDQDLVGIDPDERVQSRDGCSMTRTSRCSRS